ncbi:hypothetical protein WMY93_034133 [Mugilogobius chulae]|uniref:Gypsy retrotransposon integrase-like protein 1 n=1 Tax=Mugilogobius chulae TaxID=88201 RepID=A0AAW0MQL1_9GOBI
MDPVKVNQLVEFLASGSLPAGPENQALRDSIRQRAKNYVLRVNGNLHYICRRRKERVHLAKVVLTSKEANDIFIEFHSSAIGGHCGWEKTHRAIIDRYYWPIKECPECQKRRSSIKEKQQYLAIGVSEPFELVGMDLINAELCQKLGIKRSFCSPYHPQTNGLVEKMNGTLQGCLNKMVKRNPQTWDEYLQVTLFALRTKLQLTTRHTPYKLLYGREARYPSQVPDLYVVTDERVTELLQREEVCDGLKDQEQTHTQARANVLRSQQKTTLKRAKKGHEDHFKVGDLVLMKNIREEQRKGGKLEDDMLGPFSIINIQGKSVDLRATNGSEEETN